MKGDCLLISHEGEKRKKEKNKNCEENWVFGGKLDENVTVVVASLGISI